MQREIKFRAWDKERKEILTPERICHLDGETSKGLSESAPFLELMQYTCLTDKNGKEIYEGDCLQWEDWQQEMWGNKPADKPDIAVIIYKAPMFTWEWFRRGKPIGTDGFDLHDVDINRYEVIGNIYENPDLLKTENV